MKKLSKADELLLRVREGEVKSRKEWARELYPDKSLIMGEHFIGSIIGAMSKRTGTMKDQAFLCSKGQNGPIIELDKHEHNELAITKMRKTSINKTRKFVDVCDKTLDEQPHRKDFLDRELAATLFYSVGKYLGKSDAELMMSNKLLKQINER